jgi:hypothetical protein
MLIILISLIINNRTSSNANKSEAAIIDNINIDNADNSEERN